MRARPPDWRLPPGVDGGVWDYVHDPGVAAGYDASLAGSTLFEADVPFVARHCPPGGRLLDLGCGTGRLLVEFARRGCTVVGVDLSEPMLARARDRAAGARVSVTLVRANLVELGCLADGTFDCAACLFSTLGIVRGADARRKVVAHAFRVLRGGGQFVLHVHNRWFSARDPAGRRWLLRDWIRSWTGREAGDRPAPAGPGSTGLVLHHFTRREAVGLLKQVGFRVREVCPVGLGSGGRLHCPAWLTSLRAYGYLLAADKPLDSG
jgi:SAM-dependent methyltransferase